MLIIKNGTTKTGGSEAIIQCSKNPNGTAIDDTDVPGDGNHDLDLYQLISNGSFPVGTILPFNGDETSLPDDWKLCDGNNGTPDLNERFIKCATYLNEIGKEGGTAVQTIGKHTHTIVCTPAGGHTDYLPQKASKVSTEGNHSHIQPNSPARAPKGVCNACGPGTGNRWANRGVQARASSSAGSHTHNFSFPTTTSNTVGNHTHTTIQIKEGASGVDKNIPQSTKLFFIMKVK